MASSTSLSIARKFTYEDFCALIAPPFNPDLLEVQKKKVYDLVATWFLIIGRSPPSRLHLSGEPSSAGTWRQLSKKVDANLVQGLDPFDYFFTGPDKQTDQNTLIEYAAYSTFLQEGHAGDKAVLEKIAPQLKEVRNAPEVIFNHFNQMTEEERHLGLAICYSAGIGTAVNLELAAEHAEKAQGQILPRFAELRYARILERLVFDPGIDSDKKAIYKNKLFSLYENSGMHSSPVFILRYVHLLQTGSAETVHQDQMSDGNASYIIGKMVLDTFASNNPMDRGIWESMNMKWQDLWVIGTSMLANAADRCCHPKASALLGEVYENGHVKVDDQAFKFYSRAYELGNRDVVYSLARCYDKAIGTDQNLKKALEYYKIALGQGVHEAAMHLAKMHEEGLGTRHDEKQALEYYRIARENNVPGAVEKYAVALAKGYGGESRRKEGNQLLHKRVQEGSSAAMVELSLLSSDLFDKGSLLNKALFLKNPDALAVRIDEQLQKAGECQLYQTKKMFLEGAMRLLVTHEHLGVTQAHIKFGGFIFSNGIHDEQLKKKAIEYLEKGCELRDPRSAYHFGILYYKEDAQNSPNTKLGIEYMEKAASWGSKKARVFLIGHYLKHNGKERALHHLQILGDCPDNPPDVLAAIAVYYSYEDLGEYSDYLKSIAYMNEAIALIQDGGTRYQSYKTYLKAYREHCTDHTQLKELFYRLKKTVEETDYPFFSGSGGRSIREYIEQEKLLQGKEIQALGQDRDQEQAELNIALESYYQSVLEKVNEKQEKMLANLIADFMKKYDEYQKSPCKDLPNKHNRSKLEALIQLSETLLQARDRFKIKEQIEAANRGWVEIKTAICGRYEKQRLLLQQKEAFAKWAESSIDQIAQKVAQYQEKLRLKSAKSDEVNNDLAGKVRSLAAAGCLAIEEGKSVEEIENEIKGLLTNMNTSLDGKISSIVIGPTPAPSKGDGEELREKLSEAQKSLAETKKALHASERTAKQTEERLLEELEKQRKEFEAKLERQRQIEDKLRESNLHLSKIVNEIPKTTCVETLEKLISKRIEELRMRGITQIHGYNLKNFPPRKYDLDALEALLLGLGFRQQGEAAGSHRHYERGEESIGLSPHSDEADKAQIQEALNFFLADLNKLG